MAANYIEYYALEIFFVIYFEKISSFEVILCKQRRHRHL